MYSDSGNEHLLCDVSGSSHGNLYDSMGRFCESYGLSWEVLVFQANEIHLHHLVWMNSMEVQGLG